MKKFHMKKITTAVVLGMGSVVGTQAMAQTSVQSIEQAEAKFVAGHKVVEIGHATTVLPKLKGFATGLPVVEVLRQITPSGWLVKKNDSADNRVNIEKDVSWTGGQNWVETLGVVLLQTNANAVIDWTKKEITLFAVNQGQKVEIKEAPVTNGVSVFEISGGIPAVVTPSAPAANNVQGAVETTKVESAPAIEAVAVTAVEVVAPAPAQVAQAPAKVWTLDASKSLKENVKVWADQSGYQVEWFADDYPVPNRTLEVSGEFDGEDGPIKQLAKDYGQSSRLLKPLSFMIYQNGYLIVEEVKFEQEGFPQLAK